MARTRSPNYEDIQKSILRGAVDCFANDGYARASITDVADRCGISKGALYHYFESKESILFAILQEHVSSMIERAERAAADIVDPIQRLRSIIGAIVAMNAESPHEQVVLLNELVNLSAEDQETIRNLERRLVEFVSDALLKADYQGKIDRRTKKIYTMLLFGMINYTYTWYDAKGEINPVQFADIASDLYFLGFNPLSVRPTPAQEDPTPTGL